MKLHNKNIIITGAANGIGKALAERFVSEKPNSISLLDINPNVHTVAEQLDADGYVVDVKDEKSFMDVLDKIISKEKSIDLFCSNAGTQQFGSIDDDIHYEQMKNILPKNQWYSRNAGVLNSTSSPQLNTDNKIRDKTINFFIIKAEINGCFKYNETRIPKV